MLVIEEILDRIARHSRPRARSSCANATSTAPARRRTQHHALRPAGGRQPPRRALARAQARQRLRRPPRRDRRVQRRAPARQARPRHHPGQVRHLLQHDRLQPGRRAGARLRRRHDPAATTAAPRWARACTPRCSGVAARVLGVSRARIRLMATSTDKVPNTSATAASSGSDLNGEAVKAACETAARPPRAGGGAAARRRGRRGALRRRCRVPGVEARAAPGLRRGDGRAPTASASASRPPASTARPASTGTPRPARATRSTTSRTAPP